MQSQIILQPVMSEKAYSASQGGVYMFTVPKSATKQQVKAAVQHQYKVGVEDVRTFNRQGKAKRGLGRSRGISGSRQDTKKAYVSLKTGDKLPFFEAEQNEAAKSAKKSNASKEKK